MTSENKCEVGKVSVNNKNSLEMEQISDPTTEGTEMIDSCQIQLEGCIDLENFAATLRRPSQHFHHACQEKRSLRFQKHTASQPRHQDVYGSSPVLNSITMPRYQDPKRVPSLTRTLPAWHSNVRYISSIQSREKAALHWRACEWVHEAQPLAFSSDPHASLRNPRVLVP